MAKNGDKRSVLWHEISSLRDGYGCISNINDMEELTDLMGCNSENPTYQSSCFLILTVELLGYSKEVEDLLATFGLLKGYDAIPITTIRRKQYHQDCLASSQTEYKPDTVYRRENDTIAKLEKCLRKQTENWIDATLKSVDNKLVLLEPRYTKKPAVNPAPSKTGAIIKDALSNQTKTINELKASHVETHEQIEVISEYAKITPSIAYGVQDANEKLDEIIKLTSMPSSVAGTRTDIDILTEIRQGKHRDIKFGGYKWRALDIQDGRVLLLTESIIIRRTYESVLTMATWETCTLRKYLNGSFYKRLNERDQARILAVVNVNEKNQWFGVAVENDTSYMRFLNANTNGRSDNKTEDKIFLLSIDEVVRYFGDSGQLKNKSSDNEVWIDDEFNDNRTAEYKGDKCSWWLRSPGMGLDFAALVVGDDETEEDETCGMIYMSGEAIKEEYGVRPALWLNLVEK